MANDGSGFDWSRFVTRGPRILRRSVVRTFLAGMLAAMPLIATVALVVLAVRFIVDWLGPYSLFGRALGWLGLAVSGSHWAGYMIGLAMAIGMIFGLGILVERGLAVWLGGIVDCDRQPDSGGAHHLRHGGKVRRDLLEPRRKQVQVHAPGVVPVRRCRRCLDAGAALLPGSRSSSTARPAMP